MQKCDDGYQKTAHPHEEKSAKPMNIGRIFLDYFSKNKKGPGKYPRPFEIYFGVLLNNPYERFRNLSIFVAYWEPNGSIIAFEASTSMAFNLLVSLMNVSTEVRAY